jgi:hypothetical protein
MYFNKRYFIQFNIILFKLYKILLPSSDFAPLTATVFNQFNKKILKELQKLKLTTSHFECFLKRSFKSVAYVVTKFQF